MNIDTSINLSNILEVLGFVGGIGIVLIRQGLNAENFKKEMTDIKIELKGLATVITKLAVTDNRLTNLEEDFRELRKGRGFITERLTGEYSTHGKVNKT